MAPISSASSSYLSSQIHLIEEELLSSVESETIVVYSSLPAAVATPSTVVTTVCGVETDIIPISRSASVLLRLNLIPSVYTYRSTLSNAMRPRNTWNRDDCRPQSQPVLDYKR